MEVKLKRRFILYNFTLQKSHVFGKVTFGKSLLETFPIGKTLFFKNSFRLAHQTITYQQLRLQDSVQTHPILKGNQQYIYQFHIIHTEVRNHLIVTYGCFGTFLNHLPTYQTSCDVNQSSLFKWLLIQNCVKINGTTFFSLKLFPFIASGPQKPQTLTASKITYGSFGPKSLIPR